MTWDQLLPMLWEGTVETLYMTLWSSAIAYLIGLPLGVLLVVTRRGGIMPSVTFNAILGVAINFLRSIPFVIMIAVLFPVTRLVMGSSIGTRSVIFPLVDQRLPLHRPHGGELPCRGGSRHHRGRAIHGLHQPADHFQGAPARGPALPG